MSKTLTETPTRGSPVVVPEDGSDLRKAISIETPIQALTNRVAELERYINAAFVYPTPPSRVVTLTPVPQGDLTLAGGIIAWISGTNGLVSQANTNTVWCPLTDLPDGAVVSKIEVLVDPGAARSGSDRMELLVVKREADWSAKTFTPTTLGTVQDDTTAAVQIISLTLSPTITIDNTGDTSTSLLVGVSSGNDGATNLDKFHAIRVTFTDPGPRNY